MKENVIISAADSNYFELLNELIDSIKSFEQSKDLAICIMDAGLHKDQIEVLGHFAEQVRDHGSQWDARFFHHLARNGRSPQRRISPASQ